MKNNYFALKTFFRLSILVYLCITTTAIQAQKNKASLSFELSMDDPSTHLYHVVFNGGEFINGGVQLNMPAWTTGYYQLMNFANNVENFQAFSSDGIALKWEKTGANTWVIAKGKYSSIKVTYDVRATRNFVAGNYLDAERGYISPAGVFMYPKGMINNEVTISIDKYKNWSKIAPGLPKVKGQENTYYAKDFDILYDSPILTGNLESFPSFTVKGIPHYFEAYKAGKFDR